MSMSDRLHDSDGVRSHARTGEDRVASFVTLAEVTQLSRNLVHVDWSLAVKPQLFDGLS